jgi:hypothetical protein
MADGDFFAKPISKNEENNAVANSIFVQLSDGTTAIGVTSNALDVNIDNASLVVTAIDLDIRDLTHVSDSVKVGDGTDFLAVNADGSINAVVTATNLDIRDLTHVSDSVKVGDGTDFLGVNSDGSINVNLVVSAISGELHNADIGTPIANGIDTHTVTATGGVLIVNSITVSSSGGVKYVAKNNAVEVMTGFLGRDGNTDQILFTPAVEVASGQDFTIERTNRQGVANDVYSTVMGRQL